MKKFIKQVAEKIFGKKFRFKVELPFRSSSYYRFYYSNCFGIFYSRLTKADGTAVMISDETPAHALSFGRQFETIEDVMNYKKKEREEYERKGRFISKRLV